MTNVTLDQIDELCKTIQEQVPDAVFVTVTRCLLDGHFSWSAEVRIPARDTRFRIMKNRTMPVKASSETFEGLLQQVLITAHFYRTGQWPSKGE